ncbi:MAG: heat-inducible transcriptional repressor HrcA [Candidatus Eiseniibacteriota bacterium]
MPIRKSQTHSRTPRPTRLADLTSRQRQVLTLLVRQYLATARPVASGTLTVEGGFAWAPATVRSSMFELESLGLLEQPHAAAGRIPTDRGYRVFVDGLGAPEPLTPADREEVERALTASAHDVEQLFRQASRLLADTASELGFAIAPGLDEGVLESLELVHVAERRVLLVLTVRSGPARSVALHLTSPLGRADVERVARLLRERLLGLPFADVRGRLAGDDALVRDVAAVLVAAAIADVLAELERPEVFVDGAAYVARHPEFRESGSLRPVLQLIDRPEPWRDLLAGGSDPGLSVAIGREHNRTELAHLSLVSFRLPGPLPASIGLLGPRRMDYARAMGLVEYVGRRLSSLL